VRPFKNEYTTFFYKQKNQNDSI